MVDNQEDKLKTLSAHLEKTYGINTIKVHLDLAAKDAATTILEQVNEQECSLLVYNAAFSRINPFMALTSEELDTFSQVNVNTQLHLVHGFSNYLTSKGKKGGIILMSSLAGLIGMQLVATYAATKAFAWNLAEALFRELKDNGIDIMACVAGATSTPAYLKTRPVYGWPKPTVMKPEEVTKSALKSLGKKAIFIPGSGNRVNYFILTRLLPRKTAAAIANRTMGKMYPHYR